MSTCNGNKTSPKNIEVEDLEKAGEIVTGNGHHPEHSDCKDTSKNGRCNHTEYIPSQIVSFVRTSGVNTVSNGPSGQPTANSRRKDEGITDSTKYRESQSLYDNTGTEKESEDDPVTKKRKVESDDSGVSNVASSTENSENLEKENTIEENASNCTTSESEQMNDQIEDEKRPDQIEDEKRPECNNADTYVPSEYGSFQKSGCVSTTTKSKLSASDKIPTQSTNTPNSKGGISHEDA